MITFNQTQESITSTEMVELISINSLQGIQEGVFDSVIIISDGISSLAKFGGEKFPELLSAVENYSKISHSLDGGTVSLIFSDKIPSKRLIYSSTGPVHRDFDDVRRYTKAGISAGEKAISAGARCPMLITLPSGRFPNAQLVAAIGVLHGMYTPMVVRESARKADLLGILEFETTNKPTYNAGSLVKMLQAIQLSFDLCRDIGDGDPQRMSPLRVAEHIKQSFNGSSVKVSVTDEIEKIVREYPLMAAVTRAANMIEEHRARLIWLEYDGGGEPSETLFIVGKGVTLDTGGVDVKVGGAMCGMSRDKYGSAVVAGFFKALDQFKPVGIKVVGCMCMCRNSIGSAAYTCDEIITARSGKRVHINNTDAEGRMAMADPLTEMRERALKAKNAQLLTIATLTGHVVLTYGHCAAAMQNGPARAVQYAERLQQCGDAFGQPIEVSRLFNEDFEFHASEIEGADLKQAHTKPSVQTARGHMGPAAFLMRVSRLDECGMDSSSPLKYAHLDIGYSMGAYPKNSLPSPLLALIAHHILPRVKHQ